MTGKPSIPFWRLCLDEPEDRMLKVLIVAGVVSIITGAIQHGTEGAVDGIIKKEPYALIKLVHNEVSIQSEGTLMRNLLLPIKLI